MITKALKQLYNKPWHVKAFVAWRSWHTPYAAIERFIPEKGLIVDLGCGYGIFSNLLALRSDKREIIGVDISERKLKYANRGLPNVFFIKQDATEFRRTDCKSIILIHLLHHLSSFQQQQRLLQRCYDSLSKDGILAVLEIDKQPLWKFIFTKIIDTFAYMDTRFYFRKSSEFAGIIKSIGFKNIRIIPAHIGVPLSHVLCIAQK